MDRAKPPGRQGQELSNGKQKKLTPLEALSDIASLFGKGGSVVCLFGTTFGAFEFIERVSSKRARKDFSKWLNSRIETIADVPKYILEVFIHVFGKRHLSVKCVRSSIILSVVAITILLLIGLLNNPHGIRDFVEKIKSADDPNPLELLTHYLLIAFVGWIAYAVVVDYVNLLKTRALVNVLVNREIQNFLLLLIIFFIDFGLGMMIFTIGLEFVLFIFPLILMVSFADFIDFITSVFPLIILINAIEISPTLLTHDSVFPITNLFWASMAPSVWLWLYLMGALITRLITRSKRAINFLNYFLDVAKHPFRAVGVVAASLISILYGIDLLVSRLIL